jgi:hypothetical protein
MESRVPGSSGIPLTIAYAHAEIAEPAETHICFRDLIGLLAVNLHDAGEFRHSVAGADSEERAVLDAIVGLE